MRNIFATFLLAVIFLSSCGDWTKPESLDYRRPTPAEANPEGYGNYLSALRDFKEADHPVSMITVRAAENPEHQNQRLAGLPDSVDYICIKGITTLAPVIVDEMKQVRGQKGTKFMCVIDYVSIVDSWNALWKGTEDDPDAPDNRLPEEFYDYCLKQTRSQLSNFDKYDFDGIHISYMGNTVTETAAEGQRAFFAGLIDWRASHSAVPMGFRGYWYNVRENSDEDRVRIALIRECSFFVAVPLGSVTVLTGMDARIEGMIRQSSWVGIDDLDFRSNIIYEVAIPEIDNPQQTGVTPRVAAEWVTIPRPENTPPRNFFVKRGLAIDNAQDDYFNVSLIYSNIRQAIGLMNPESQEQSPTE